MRYIRLYLHFLQFSFSKAMEFRVDFTFRIIMDTIFYVVNISFFKIIYLHTPMIGGWREDQMMIFVCSYLLIDALQMTIFSSNMWWLPITINKGDLDYYLVKPVSSLFFISLREFSANSFINLLIALGLITHALFNYQDPIQFWDLLLYMVLIINGLFLYYIIQMLMIIPVFWTQSARGFNDLFFALSVSFERPDRIFTKGLRIFFTYILPFSLIASFPARLFFEPFEYSIFFHLVGMTILFWLILIGFWKLGLKNYSSASS